MGDKRTIDSSFPLPMDLFFFTDCSICYRHLRCRSFFRSAVKSKYRGLLTFQIRYKVLKRGGNLSLLALTSVNISQDIFNFFA